MKKNMLESKVKQIRGKVAKQWEHFADHDLDKIIGKRDQMVGLVQEKYGYTKNKAEKDVDYMLKKLNLRPDHKQRNIFSIVAVSIGSMLTIALFFALARRLVSAEEMGTEII